MGFRTSARHIYYLSHLYNVTEHTMTQIVTTFKGAGTLKGVVGIRLNLC